MKVKELYKKLIKLYGPQGWWPINNKYKKGHYKEKTEKEKFEICIGAILTQNTSWKNVQKALKNLEKINAISPKKILSLKKEKIISAIRPAGYFNQKYQYIINFSKFFIKNNQPTRKQLLSIKGIGPETADSILLYAYNKAVFVVDLYTKRIFHSLNITKEKNYNKIKEIVENQLPKDYRIFNEFHALLVEHAKRYYSKKPYGLNDPLKNNNFK